MFGTADACSWWDESFDMGRAPRDSKYCGARYALFELFAPLERAPAPVYRHLLHSPRAVVMGRGDPGRAEEVESVAHQTATSTFSVGATSVELGGLLRAYIDTLPQCVIRAVGAREELVGPEGGVPPLGVAFGPLDVVSLV